MEADLTDQTEIGEAGYGGREGNYGQETVGEAIGEEDEEGEGSFGLYAFKVAFDIVKQTNIN